jgi:hypothetical protein
LPDFRRYTLGKGWLPGIESEAGKPLTAPVKAIEEQSINARHQYMLLRRCQLICLFGNPGRTFICDGLRRADWRRAGMALCGKNGSECYSESIARQQSRIYGKFTAKRFMSALCGSTLRTCGYIFAL